MEPCGVGDRCHFKINGKPGFARIALAKPKSQGQKWVKLLSKLILDFGLAKGEYTVEF
jgi:hypothetical protein